MVVAAHGGSSVNGLASDAAPAESEDAEVRVSRSGLVIATTYAVLATGCVVWGYSLPGPKESTVLMQLPVVPALLVLEALGLVDWFAGAPLVVFYGLCIPAIAAGLYTACWLFGALGFRTRLVIGVGALGVLSIMLFWPVRR